jgi:hypothetical protein
MAASSLGSLAYSLPIWWNGFSAEPDASARIIVRDADGTIVAVEGGTFEMVAASELGSIQGRNRGSAAAAGRGVARLRDS